MKNLTLIFGAAVLSISLRAAAEPTLVDHCYFGIDSDTSTSSGFNQRVDIKVWLDERGYYARVENQCSHDVIAEKMPLEMVFPRDAHAVSWVYRSLALPNAKLGGTLEVYLTSVRTRSPTGVAAHFHFHSTDAAGASRIIGLQRLECESKELK